MSQIDNVVAFGIENPAVPGAAVAVDFQFLGQSVDRKLADRVGKRSPFHRKGGDFHAEQQACFRLTGAGISAYEPLFALPAQGRDGLVSIDGGIAGIKRSVFVRQRQRRVSHAAGLQLKQTE